MIHVDDLHLSLGDTSVLDGVDLRVEEGEFVGLVGPNGAGKTSLLRCINGVLEPDAGTVEVDGESVTAAGSGAVSRLVATVPQDGTVRFDFSVEQVVEMGRTPHRSRLDWSDGHEAVERAMERAGVAQFRDRDVSEVSGGERQRVLLARALAQETPVLLLDEPTASLDVNHQVRVLGLAADLVSEGRTVLAAVHDLDLAARYCDRLCLLHDGRIGSRGEPQTVLDADALDEAFGTAAAVTLNPVSGTPSVTAVRGRRDRDRRVHVVGGGEPGARAASALWRAGWTVTLGVVPEGDVAAETARSLGCEVVAARPFGTPTAAGSDVREMLERADVVVDAGGPGSEWTREVAERSDGVDGLVDVEDGAVGTLLDQEGDFPERLPPKREI